MRQDVVPVITKDAVQRSESNMLCPAQPRQPYLNLNNIREAIPTDIAERRHCESEKLDKS
jgi:hypothetical protein